MRQALMDILACPLCKGPLVLTIAAVEADEVLTGELVCEACSERYPIAEGIPNLLPPAVRAQNGASPSARSGAGWFALRMPFAARKLRTAELYTARNRGRSARICAAKKWKGHIRDNLLTLKSLPWHPHSRSNRRRACANCSPSGRSRLGSM